MAKPMEGIVILDMSRFISGPYCAGLLAQMGAEVIKLEKPQMGEDMRDINYKGIPFTPYNLNKKSLALNVRDPQGIEIIKKLLPHVDVLIQNFRPGTMEKMGLGDEALRQINPELIVVNISGYGQDGPYSQRVAFDGVIQAESGLAESTRQATGGYPYLVGGYPCDVCSGLFSTIAVLAALNQRDQQGVGQSMDIDMFSSMTSFLSDQLAYYGATGETTHKQTSAPCGYCQAKDAYIRIDAGFDQWEALRELMKLPILFEERYDDPQMRLEDNDKLIEAMESWTSRYNAEEAVQKLAAAGIAAGVVKSIDRIHDDKHLRATQKIVDVEVPGYGALPFTALPFTMSGFEPVYQRAPLLGEDTDAVMRRYLHMSDTEIASLKADGVIA